MGSDIWEATQQTLKEVEDATLKRMEEQAVNFVGLQKGKRYKEPEELEEDERSESKSKRSKKSKQVDEGNDPSSSNDEDMGVDGEIEETEDEKKIRIAYNKIILILVSPIIVKSVNPNDQNMSEEDKEQYRSSGLMPGQASASSSGYQTGYGYTNSKGKELFVFKGKEPWGDKRVILPASCNDPLIKMGIQLEHMRTKVDRKIVITMHRETFDSMVKEGYGALWDKKGSQSAKVQRDTWLRFAKKALIQHNT